MPYIIEYHRENKKSFDQFQGRCSDQGKDLAVADCDFCGIDIVVPAARLNQNCYCSEKCFVARYGAHCSEVAR